MAESTPSVPTSNSRWWLAVAVAAVVLFAVLPLLLAVLDEGGLSGGQSYFWQFRLAELFLLAMYAVSYNILLGYTGILNLGHALFFGGGAYVMSVGMVSLGQPMALAFPAGILAGILFALGFGWISNRVSGIYLAMVTLALGEAAVLIVEAPDLYTLTGSEDGLRGVPVPEFIHPSDSRFVFYLLCLTLAVLAVAVTRWFINSPSGRVLLAIRENDERTQFLGYPVKRYRLLAFAASGAIAAVAGVVSAVLHRGAAPQQLTIDHTAIAILAVVIGGKGTMLGPLVGVVVVVLGQDVLRAYFGAAWLLVFAAIGAALLLRAPDGIVGVIKGRLGKRRQKRISGAEADERPKTAV